MKHINLPSNTFASRDFLDFDNSAYTAYHKFQTEWPCLSFDIIRDSLGFFRNKVSFSVLLLNLCYLFFVFVTVARFLIFTGWDSSRARF